MKKIILLVLLSICASKELFEDYYDEATRIMAKMTMEQRIGQLFFPRFDSKRSIDDIKERYAGGFVLFADDFKFNETEIINRMNNIQNLSNSTIGLPLGLAVDEEGGTVVRVSMHHRKERFPSPMDIYNKSGIQGILKIDQEKRDLLRKFKMNINLAPVADIAYNSSSFIYKRTLGKKPEETTKYIAADVEGYNNDGFTCCAKHFPGYGNNVDTHKSQAHDLRPYYVFLEEDFMTFNASIAKEIPMILVSHNIVDCKDNKYPASISKIWHDILRKDLNFSGLILTDDLAMGAMKNLTLEVPHIINAVNAGNDILLTSNYMEDIEYVKKAVENRTIAEETINTACKRIIAWKLKYLIHKDFKKKTNVVDKSKRTWIVIVAIVGVSLLTIGVILLVRYLKREENTDEVEDLNQSGPKFE